MIWPTYYNTGHCTNFFTVTPYVHLSTQTCGPPTQPTGWSRLALPGEGRLFDVVVLMDGSGADQLPEPLGRGGQQPAAAGGPQQHPVRNPAAPHVKYLAHHCRRPRRAAPCLCISSGSLWRSLTHSLAATTGGRTETLATRPPSLRSRVEMRGAAAGAESDAALDVTGQGVEPGM